jgi:two-component system sensor kinase FixL
MGRCANATCQATEVVDAMRAELRQIREIINHLRSLAQPARADFTDTSLNRMVENLVPLLLRECATAGVTIQTSLDASLPLLPANSVQLKQVLINLVRNSIEACASARPPDGGTVRISTRRLNDDAVELVVRDNGPGFAPGIAERIFEPFVTSKPHGTGIGLRLCRRIINAHSGTIEGLPNPDGPGVSFRVRLPLGQTPSPTAQDDAKGP